MRIGNNNTSEANRPNKYNLQLIFQWKNKSWIYLLYEIILHSLTSNWNSGDLDPNYDLDIAGIDLLINWTYDRRLINILT